MKQNTQILKHLKTEKHKRCLNIAASSSKVQDFFQKTCYGDEDRKKKEVAIRRGAFGLPHYYSLINKRK